MTRYNTIIKYLVKYRTHLKSISKNLKQTIEKDEILQNATKNQTFILPNLDKKLSIMSSRYLKKQRERSWPNINKQIPKLYNFSATTLSAKKEILIELINREESKVIATKFKQSMENIQNSAKNLTSALPNLDKKLSLSPGYLKEQMQRLSTDINKHLPEKYTLLTTTIASKKQIIIELVNKEERENKHFATKSKQILQNIFGRLRLKQSIEHGKKWTQTLTPLLQKHDKNLPKFLLNLKKLLQQLFITNIIIRIFSTALTTFAIRIINKKPSLDPIPEAPPTSDPWENFTDLSTNQNTSVDPNFEPHIDPDPWETFSEASANQNPSGDAIFDPLILPEASQVFSELVNQVKEHGAPTLGALALMGLTPEKIVGKCLENLHAPLGAEWMIAIVIGKIVIKLYMSSAAKFRSKVGEKDDLLGAKASVVDKNGTGSVE